METKIGLLIVCFIVTTNSLSVLKTDSHMSYDKKHTQEIKIVDPVSAAAEAAA
jgi:hypothetical protein